MPGKIQAVKFAKALAIAAIMENPDAVIAWIRGYLVESLAPVTPGHLAAAISNDTDFWKGLPEARKRLIHALASRKMVKETFRQYSSMVTTETFMKWLQEDRPDLLSIIINWPDDRAEKWLDRSLREVKTSFLEAMG